LPRRNALLLHARRGGEKRRIGCCEGKGSMRDTNSEWCNAQRDFLKFPVKFPVTRELCAAKKDGNEKALPHEKSEWLRN
jgi:hypothetical protein